MKQSSFLLGAAALMLATACSNDEVVSVAPQSGAIGFSSFVDNSTRATDITEANLENFKVWGVRDFATAGINKEETFGGLEVSKDGTAWTYSKLQYWVVGADYSFAAIAPYATPGVEVEKNAENPMVAAGLKLTLDNSNAEGAANGELDLLFAEDDSKRNVGGAGGAEMSAVGLTFNHMLSRVRFQFVDEMSTDYYIAISDVVMEGAVSKATVDKSAGASLWTAVEVEGEETNTSNYDFAMTIANTKEDAVNSAVTTHKYLIPVTGTQDVTAKFTIKLYNKIGDVQIGKDLKHEVTINGLELKNNCSYTLKAIIDDTTIEPNPDDPQLNPIQFTVEEVIGWTPNQDGAETEIPGYTKPAEGESND